MVACLRYACTALDLSAPPSLGGSSQARPTIVPPLADVCMVMVQLSCCWEGRAPVCAHMLCCACCAISTVHLYHLGVCAYHSQQAPVRMAGMPAGAYVLGEGCMGARCTVQDLQKQSCTSMRACKVQRTALFLTSDGLRIPADVFCCYPPPPWMSLHRTSSHSKS